MLALATSFPASSINAASRSNPMRQIRLSQSIDFHSPFPSLFEVPWVPPLLHLGKDTNNFVTPTSCFGSLPTLFFFMPSSLLLGPDPPPQPPGRFWIHSRPPIFPPEFPSQAKKSQVKRGAWCERCARSIRFTTTSQASSRRDGFLLLRCASVTGMFCGVRTIVLRTSKSPHSQGLILWGYTHAFFENPAGSTSLRRSRHLALEGFEALGHLFLGST